jgi:uncharacterized membrane protein YbhN (UPF0104 family)
VRAFPKVWSGLRFGLALAVALWIGHALFTSHLIAVWRSVRVPWLVSALALTTIMVGIRLTKWHLLLIEGRVLGSRCESARSFLGAYALGCVTPGRVGDYSRCIFVAKGSQARTLLFTFVDKAFDVLAVLSLAVVSLFLLAPCLVAVLGSAIWLGLVLAGNLVLSRHHWLGTHRLAKLSQLVDTLGRVRRGHFAAWALTASALDLLTLALLLQAFNGRGLTVALATYPWLVIAGGLPISFGGIGPREGVSALLLPVFSISAGVAVNVSLAFFAFTVLLPSTAGAIWMAARPPELGWRICGALKHLIACPSATPACNPDLQPRTQKANLAE